MACLRTISSGAAGVLYLLAGSATGVAAREVETARMTSAEVAAALAGGATTIIIPTGGTEQNGDHMVTGKHNAVVAVTANRIAGQLGNALVAPVLAYVPEGSISDRTGHMAFPGTISLPPETFTAVLESAAESFRAHGFKLVVFLGDSGGNQDAQVRLARRLTAEWSGSGAEAVSARAYYEANDGPEWLAAQGFPPDAPSVHAGVRDTSELMAADPGGVREDLRLKAANGAERASAVLGEMLLDLKVKAAVREIAAAEAARIARPPPPSGLFARVWSLIFG